MTNDKHVALEVLATTCTAGNCPTIFSASENEVIVQGYVERLDAPTGEQMVRVPIQLLRDALHTIDA